MKTYLTTLIQQLFHQHTYVKIGFREASNQTHRWSVRRYRCDHCGKEKWVDGRFDPYE